MSLVELAIAWKAGLSDAAFYELLDDIVIFEPIRLGKDEDTIYSGCDNNAFLDVEFFVFNDDYEVHRAFVKKVRDYQRQTTN